MMIQKSEHVLHYSGWGEGEGPKADAFLKNNGQLPCLACIEPLNIYL